MSPAIFSFALQLRQADSNIGTYVGGQVAAALKANADQMIVGGWDNGVLKNFQVFDVLSAAT